MNSQHSASLSVNQAAVSLHRVALPPLSFIGGLDLEVAPSLVHGAIVMLMAYVDKCYHTNKTYMCM